MASTHPTFSLIVNTTDRADSLAVLLRALEHQTYPDFEVIVVVGPTQDHTMDVLARYQGRVRVLHCDDANLSRSRNIGLLAARGDVVAYIDDDAVPSLRWLEQLARLFANPALDATGGVVHIVHPRQPVMQHRVGITSSLAEQHNVRASYLEQAVPQGEGMQWLCRMMGTNMAFRRQALLEVGGFDEFYAYVAEETDLAVRMVNAGHSIRPVLEAPVYHIPASSRNRVVFTNVGRWWLQTRSLVYFAAKNGRTAGDDMRTILRHILYRVHGHWLWYNGLRRSGQLTFSQMLWRSLEEVWAGLEGSWAGFFRPRRTLASHVTQTAREEKEGFVPFPKPDASPQP
ncbi:MAG: glycosyltransferase family 2 protein, partial [Caldilineae bacterium]